MYSLKTKATLAIARFLLLLLLSFFKDTQPFFLSVFIFSSFVFSFCHKQHLLLLHSPHTYCTQILLVGKCHLTEAIYSIDVYVLLEYC